MGNPDTKEEEKFIDRTQDEIDVRIGTENLPNDDKERKDNTEKKEHTFSFWKRKKSIVPVSPTTTPYDVATISLLGRKTFTGGALNMGLVASNTDQLLTVITSKPELNGLDIAKIVLISLSLTVQIVLMLTLAWIGMLKPILSYPVESEKEVKLEKKYQILNNLAVFLSCITTFLNVMITSFNGHSMPPSNKN